MEKKEKNNDIFFKIIIEGIIKFVDFLKNESNWSFVVGNRGEREKQFSFSNDIYILNHSNARIYLWNNIESAKL